MATVRRTTAAAAVLKLLCALPCMAHAIRCNPGSYQTGNQCIPCAPGYYQTNQNQTSCEPCLAGYFAPFPGSFSFSHCLQCSPGTFSKSGSSSCTPCPEGQPSGVASTRCGYCEPGSGYDRQRGNCYSCDPGYYNDGTMVVCKMCPSGTRASKYPSTSCVNCPPGTYQDLRYAPFGESKCPLCPITTYADQDGSVQCKLCPLGTVSKKGSTNCTSCPPGTFRTDVRLHNCEPCEPGTSSKGFSPARCRHPLKGCPWGTFEDNLGECRACLPGERLDTAQRKCVSCDSDEISPGRAATKCTRCPPGQEPISSFSIFEKSFCQCKLGLTKAADGSCKKCPAGTYGSDRPAGAFLGSLERRLSKREPYCTECPAGSYSGEGMEQCRICPEGTVGSGERAKSCVKCPPGTRSNPGLHDFKSGYYSLPHRFCERLKDGCAHGTTRDRTTFCNVKFCFPEKIGIPQMRCMACASYERYDPNLKQCVVCPTGTGNRVPHLSTTCSVCSEHMERSFDDGICRCKEGFIHDGKKCVQCGPKKVAVDNKCVSCKEGVPVVKFGITSCSKCYGNEYKATPQSETCTKCPEGYIRATNVVGDEIDECRPISEFPAQPNVV